MATEEYSIGYEQGKQDGFNEAMSQQRKSLTDEERAAIWAEGYRIGIADERTSEANIGIAGFDAKVEPARQNPYGAAQQGSDK